MSEESRAVEDASRLRGRIPSVSVIMTVYNAEKYVERSVKSILDQTLRDFEFIIVDDGSTDRSLRLLEQAAKRDPRVILVCTTNRGRSGALNLALSLARAKYVANLDNDDLCNPERLQREFEFLEAHPSVVCVGTWFSVIDSRDRLIREVRLKTAGPEIDDMHLRGWCQLCHSSVMFRRSAALSVGAYDPKYSPAEDFDLWLRLGEVGQLVNLPEVLVQFRVHDRSLSQSTQARMLENTRLACQAASARRGVPSVCEMTEPDPDRANDRKGAQRFALECGWSAFKRGDRSTAIAYGFKAVSVLPVARAGWQLLICALLRPRAS